VKLAVPLALAVGDPETEWLALGAAVTLAAVVAAVEAASDGAGVLVADAAPDDEEPACTAGPTSGCLPDLGSVSRPQVFPAVLRVLP
jgi:hypothetical protein